MCVAARLCRKSCREAVSGAILAERSNRLHPGSSFLSSRFLVWGGIMYVELEFQPFLINRNGSNGIPCRISCRDCDTFWAQKLDSAFEICQYVWPCNTLPLCMLSTISNPEHLESRWKILRLGRHSWILSSESAFRRKDGPRISTNLCIRWTAEGSPRLAWPPRATV